jgi:hypothetical protein
MDPEAKLDPQPETDPEPECITRTVPLLLRQKVAVSAVPVPLSAPVPQHCV